MKWNFFKRKTQSQQVQENRSESVFDYLSFNTVGSYTQSKALMLSTVYRCVEVVSDSIAQLPIEVFRTDDEGYKYLFKEHPTYRVLLKEPNPNMTRYTFMKTMVISMLLQGNAYAYIDRDRKGQVKGLYMIPSGLVTVLPPIKVKDGVRYSIAGIGMVESINMIHLVNFSYDGIVGISTLRHAVNTLGLATDADKSASNFFKNGGNLSGVLTVSTPLSKEQKQQLKNAWTNAFQDNAGGTAILESGMTYTPISINPTDAQLLESRKFNIVEICRYFGVSPMKAFDYSNTSYNSVEAAELAFLTDTLAPLLSKIELEFERKLFLPSEKDYMDLKFNTSVLLRADKASLAAYYQNLFNIGAMSPNEIRRNLDLTPIEGGDTTYIQVNLAPVKTVMNNLPTDNKLNNVEEEEQPNNKEEETKTEE